MKYLVQGLIHVRYSRYVISPWRIKQSKRKRKAGSILCRIAREELSNNVTFRRE